MSEIKRSANVHWAGDLTSGRGQITTESKALNGAEYSVPTRFKDEKGTNPEELIAAAHASCFSMMLAKILTDQKRSVEQIDTKATVVMNMDPAGPKITEIHLETQGKVMGTSNEEFQKAAEEAKEKCPISNLLRAGLQKITLQAKVA